MSSKKNDFILLVGTCLVSALITNTFANPISEKLLSAFAFTQNWLSAYVLNSVFSQLPNYEQYSLVSRASSLFLGFIGGCILCIYLSIPSTDYELDDTDEEIECQDETVQANSEVNKALSHLLSVVRDSISKWFYKRGFQVLFGIGFCLFNLWILQSSIITSIASDTVKKIEIVSPYIEDSKYKKLKSDFFLIENYDDYDRLDEELNAIMKSEGLS